MALVQWWSDVSSFLKPQVGELLNLYASMLRETFRLLHSRLEGSSSVFTGENMRAEEDRRKHWLNLLTGRGVDNLHDRGDILGVSSLSPCPIFRRRSCVQLSARDAITQ